MKYWVFDLDGTLVDSLTVHFQTLEKVFRTFGLSFGPENHQEVLKLSSSSLPNYFQEKLGIENSVAAQGLFKELTLKSINSILPFAGIENLLRLLKSNHIQLAVWTARDLEATTQILKSTGLGTYFSICISGSCVAQGKPHPEGLSRIAGHFQCSSVEMVMVGDFDSDMMGAKAFGCVPIRILWHSTVEKKKCEIAHHQFYEVDQLATWIKSQLL